MVDSNVGRLGRALRMMGYDTAFTPNDIDDDALVHQALREGRVVLTRDTHILERRVVVQGRLKALLIRDDNWRQQLVQVEREFKLDWRTQQFTRCLECNVSLVAADKEQVKDLVPAHVYRTQTQYKQCPQCHRVYWQGSHWLRMKRELERLLEPEAEETTSAGQEKAAGP